MKTQPPSWSYYCGLQAWGLLVTGSVTSWTFGIPLLTSLPLNTTVVVMLATVYTDKVNKQQQTKKPSGYIHIFICWINSCRFMKYMLFVNPMRKLARLATLCNARTSLTQSIRTGLNCNTTIVVFWTNPIVLSFFELNKKLYDNLFSTYCGLSILTSLHC